jgi:hypothetical protein
MRTVFIGKNEDYDLGYWEGHYDGRENIVGYPPAGKHRSQDYADGYSDGVKAGLRDCANREAEGE